AEASLADWQSRQDGHPRDAHEAARAAEDESARIDLPDKPLLDSRRRRESLSETRVLHDTGTLAASLAELEAREAELRERLEQATVELESRRQAFADAERAEQEAQAQLAELRKRDQALRGRLSALEALQHAALGDDQPERRALLQRLGLHGGRRLGAALQVDAGWEQAVETVLAGWLDAALQDDPDAFVTAVAAEGEHGLSIVADRDHARGPQGSLAGHVTGPAPALRMLARVRTASDVDAARRLLPTLDTGESVITPDGVWMGNGFVRTVRGTGGQAGVLARGNEIAAV